MGGVCHRPLTLRKLSGIAAFSAAFQVPPPPTGYDLAVTFRRSAGPLLLLALLSAAPATARAEFSAAISGGAYLPSGSSPFGAFQARPSAALSVGWDSDYFGGAIWAGIVSTQAGVLLQENCFPVMARVRGRLPLGVAVPFVFGGVGFAPSRALLDLVRFDTVAFTAQAGAGVDLVFGDMFTIGVEGGYLWLAPSYPFGTVDLDGTLLLATFALRFP